MHRTRRPLGDGRPLAPWLAALIPLLFLHAGAAGQPAAQPSRVDRQSGVAFPVVLAPAGGGPLQQLTGTATRQRTIFRVKVCAYGLYVEADAAHKHLASFAGRPVSELNRDRTFFRRLLDMRIPMTLRLVMTRDVAGDAMREAFDDALEPRVEHAASELKMHGGEAALGRFRGYFNVRELAEGTEIVFSCGPDGLVRTTVGDRSTAEIDSRALCWALFDVYLGERSISASGRRSLVAGFPDVLAGSR